MASMTGSGKEGDVIDVMQATAPLPPQQQHQFNHAAHSRCGPHSQRSEPQNNLSEPLLTTCSTPSGTGSMPRQPTGPTETEHAPGIRRQHRRTSCTTCPLRIGPPGGLCPMITRTQPPGTPCAWRTWSPLNAGPRKLQHRTLSPKPHAYVVRGRCPSAGERGSGLAGRCPRMAKASARSLHSHQHAVPAHRPQRRR